MTETDVALITVADNPVAAGSTIELCYNEQGELINIKNIYSAYMSDLGTVYFEMCIRDRSWRVRVFSGVMSSGGSTMS